MTKALPVIFGLAGETLNDAERALFQANPPVGFILFKRNCKDKPQLRSLTDNLRDLTNARVPIFIDQEGGRVARLVPPIWRKPPPAGLFAGMYSQNQERARRLVYLNARLIAAELAEMGITGNCAPLADLKMPGAHDIIGDRAYGETPEQVADLAQHMAQGLMDGGVLPVLKHLPGHGRAHADSHEELPVVTAPLAELEATDFVPFKRLAHLPYGMTAHIRYTALDPEQPATLSKRAIDYIRQQIGFKGLLMTDDLSMKALSGTMQELTKASLAAGCDLILHCNGDRTEMEAVAESAGEASATVLAAIEAANQALVVCNTDEEEALALEYSNLMGPAPA